MAEEATSDVKEEVELTTTPEASAEEVKVEVETEVEEPTEGEETEGDESAEDAEEEAAETETDQPAEPDPEAVTARKEQLTSEIRALVSDRNALRSEVERLNGEAYHPQTAQELIDDGMDPILARVEASEQRAQMAEYNAHVADLTANLNQQANEVMRDFPVFDPQSPSYNAGLAKRVTDVYTKAAQIKTDPRTGLTVSANVLPYEFYKAFAETHSAGAQNGQVSGQRSAEKMLAAAETPSAAAPKTPAEDNFLKGLLGSTN